MSPAEIEAIVTAIAAAFGIAEEVVREVVDRAMQKLDTTPLPDASAPCASPETRMPRNRPKAAIATASFSSDSPSARIDSRLGAPTSRKMPITAAGSVVDTTAPSSRQTTRFTPVAQWTTRPTKAMQTTTAMIASNSTAEISSSRRRTSMFSPAVNSSPAKTRV